MPDHAHLPPSVQEWAARGTDRELAGHRIFTIDTPAVTEHHPPVLVLHGFPTCSYDWRAVLPALTAQRRVVLFDMVGYGLSDKPDSTYPLDTQADVAVALMADLGIDTFSLLTHDMGDTVGGELLARQAEGTFEAEIVSRVVTNGSIYIEMAHLTPGQEVMLSLPDAKADPSMDVGADGLRAALGATFSPSHPLSDEEGEALAALVRHRDGHLLMPRIIRYIEERRQRQERFTGAIETHPSPLTIVWGTEDPVAVRDMATRLAETRRDAHLTWLDGVGHYPMVETPARFAEPALEGLDVTGHHG